MNCAWAELIKIMPEGLRSQVDMLEREMLQEIRLRIHQQPVFICAKRTVVSGGTVSGADLSYIINAASRYSPWAAATSAQGYITAPGGHRIGICGECVVDNGIVTSVRTVHSLCVRIARDFSGIAEGLPEEGSVLILGPPGSGKTTLLRALIRKRAEKKGRNLAVVDERGELFPPGIWSMPRIDVLYGCAKPAGMDMLLRTMGPDTIAVDEITSEEDCKGLLSACWCGTQLLATAHAEDVSALQKRSIYRPLWDAQVFPTVIIMSQDKTWRKERLLAWI